MLLHPCCRATLSQIAEHFPGTLYNLHFMADIESLLLCNELPRELEYFPLLCPSHTWPDSISQWSKNEMEPISVKCSIKQQRRIKRCHKEINSGSLSLLDWKKYKVWREEEERNHEAGTITVEGIRQRRVCD